MSNALATELRLASLPTEVTPAEPDSPEALSDVSPGSSQGAAAPGFGFGVGHVLAERYRLEALLGRGGFGGVYRAHDLRLDVPVAIKLIPGAPTVEPHILESLELEARLVIRMNHPNIVRFFNFERVHGASFIVMEHVPGENLHQFRKRVGSLSEREVGYIAMRCLDALEYAQAHRVVHRDVKPSNILLAPGPGSSILVKMVDFGIARQLKEDQGGGDQATSSGTPVYMSPEQLRGGFDHRTDLYSLGVTLYEMLSGRPPFCQGGLEAVIWQILNEAPPRLEGVSEGLLEIIERALAKDPADRFQSAREFREALESLASKPVATVQPALNLDLDPAPPPCSQLAPRTSVAVEDFEVDASFRLPGSVMERPTSGGQARSTSTLGTVLAGAVVFALGFGLTFMVPSVSFEPALPQVLPIAVAVSPEQDLEPPRVVEAESVQVDPIDAPEVTPEVASVVIAVSAAGGDASAGLPGKSSLELGDEAVRKGVLAEARMHYVASLEARPTAVSRARLAALDDALEILEFEGRGRVEVALIRWRNLMEREVEGPIEVLGARGVARLRRAASKPDVAVTFGMVERRAQDASIEGEIELWQAFLERFDGQAAPQVEEAKVRLGELRIKRRRLLERL